MSRLASRAVHALFLISVMGLMLGCKPSSEPADQAAATTESGETQPAATDMATPTTDANDAVPMEPIVPAQPMEPGVPEQAVEPATPQTTLAVGDPAPSLAIGQWIKGEPISAFADGHVYVVEFWATWCGPCLSSMPHISGLQDEYSEEVTFIGISDENEELVRGFMSNVQDEETQKTWDEVLTYTIALDDNDATGDAYMRAAGQNGIPTAFVVGKDGRVEWIGHPMKIDGPLKKIVADEWDRDKALAAEEAMRNLSKSFLDAQQSGDWSVPLQMIDEMVVDQPEEPQLQRVKLRILLVAQKFDEAHVLADELAQQFQDDPRMLNEIAWGLVANVPPEQQNLELALRVARQASSLSDDQDPSVLDTVARVYYMQGNLEEAIAWQKKALEAAPEGAADAMKETLEQYESELTPTESEATEEETQAAEEHQEGSEEHAEEGHEEGSEEHAEEGHEEGSDEESTEPEKVDEETDEPEVPAVEVDAETEDPPR